MKGLSVGALGALLLGTAAAAGAQDSNTIGNPALRDFQLHPRQQQPQTQTQPPLVTPPPPAAVRPQPAPPPAQSPAQQPQAPQPQAQQPRPAPAAAPRAQTPVQTPQARPATPPPSQAQPQAAAPAPEAAPPTTTETPAPAAPAPLPPAMAPPPSEGGISWRYLLPAAAAALVLIGLALLLHRRRRQAEAEAWTEEMEAPAMVSAPPAAPAPAPVAAPAPDPAMRPWLELSVKVERAQTTLTETVVNFELEIANTGKTAARNLRIDVKMFNAGAEQDKEIGAFFRTAGRESTKLNLPGIPAETTGVINASVTMAREDMRAVVLEEKYLFVPVIAVNALYDWGEGRSGQTSKSYVVGRELQQPGDKMGAFRVDQGPRVWRTIGQRKHSLERRV